MSGRELLEVMDNYSNRLDQESLITTERLMYEHCIKDNLPAIIKNLKNVVGSFAFRAISLQVSQSEHYKCVLVKESSNKHQSEYDVSRFIEKATNGNATTIDDSTLSLTNNARTNLEISSGIVSLNGHRTHQTTLISCTCQYPTSWGIPCRHMLRLHSILNWEYFADCVPSIISKNWNLYSSDEVIAENIEPSFSYEPTFVEDTKINRESKIMSLARTLCDAVSTSSSKSNEVISLLTNQLEKVTGRNDLHQTTIMHNPQLDKEQNTNRFQPGDVSAPTNKTAKRAGVKRRRDENNEKKREKANLCALV